MLIVLLTVLLNFALDPLFIFGWGPVPALGVAGAAMATLSTQAAATAIGFALLFGGHHGLRPRLADFRPDWEVIWTTFRLGLPASVEQATRALSMTLMTLLVASFGTVAVAAYGIGLRILTFVVIPAMGVAMATTTLVAQNLGAGKLQRAEHTTLIAGLISFCIPTVGGVFLYLFSVPLATFFVPNSQPAIEESAVPSHHRLCARAASVCSIRLPRRSGAGNTMAAMLLTDRLRLGDSIPARVRTFATHVAGHRRHLVVPPAVDGCLRYGVPGVVPRRRLETHEAARRHRAGTNGLGRIAD